jgi:hypothetical protein
MFDVRVLGEIYYGASGLENHLDSKGSNEFLVF